MLLAKVQVCSEDKKTVSYVSSMSSIKGGPTRLDGWGMHGEYSRGAWAYSTSLQGWTGLFHFVRGRTGLFHFVALRPYYSFSLFLNVDVSVAPTLDGNFDCTNVLSFIVGITGGGIDRNDLFYRREMPFPYIFL